MTGSLTGLITGAGGQDGWYLAEALARNGWNVVAALSTRAEIVDFESPIRTASLDITDEDAVGNALIRFEPDVVFNLAAVSSVAASWDAAQSTAVVNALGVANILVSVERYQQRSGRRVHVIQASSSEVFGSPAVSPQNELTKLAPTNPYGAAKAYAQFLCSSFRQRDVRSACLVLYNHESPRRPPHFLSRKVTMAVAQFARGFSDPLRLGNLDAQRDWGWAPDYMEALRLAAEQRYNGELVIATGEAHSVREFVAEAFNSVGISDWDRFVEVDKGLFRPSDSPLVVGDSSLASRSLGWAPTKYFKDVVRAMVEADLKLLG